MHSKTLLIGRADGWFNLRLASRVLWVNLTLIALALLLALFALCYGTLSISPGQVWQALQGKGLVGL